MEKNYEEMVAEAREDTEQVSIEEVNDKLQSGEEFVVLDVREPGEWQEGHIPGAKLIPRGVLEYLAADELPEKDARIVVHCAVGGRGTLATRTLQEMGYTNVANMQGGTNAWNEKEYELETGG
ncbi:MAG: rhodanese-like domain-containing protein [Rubrobacteraceae bacterium]